MEKIDDTLDLKRKTTSKDPASIAIEVTKRVCYF